MVEFKRLAYEAFQEYSLIPSILQSGDDLVYQESCHITENLGVALLLHAPCNNPREIHVGQHGGMHQSRTVFTLIGIEVHLNAFRVPCPLTFIYLFLICTTLAKERLLLRVRVS